MIDGLLLLLMVYFITMNLTVERCYCSMSVEACAADGWLLGQETLDFCKQNNPLFLARPEWLRVATCASAYVFILGYALIAIAAACNMWAALSLPIALFIGAKLYGIAFYHYMEFTSAMPPTNLVPYFAAEGPYIVSIVIVIRRLAGTMNSTPPRKKLA